MERVGSRYWCKVCRCKSSTKATLETQRCKGSAVDRWQEKARHVPARKSTAPTAPRNCKVIKAHTKQATTKAHSIVVSGDLFWCIVCGAFAESAPKLLGKGCRARHQGKWKAGGMPGQLKVLLSGRHPKTLKPIPKPVAIRRWQATAKGQLGQSEAIEVWRGRGSEDWPIQNPPKLEDDGTALTSAFLRKGRVPEDPEKPSVLERIRAKLAAAANSTTECTEVTERKLGIKINPFYARTVGAVWQKMPAGWA